MVVHYTVNNYEYEPKKNQARNGLVKKKKKIVVKDTQKSEEEWRLYNQQMEYERIKKQEKRKLLEYLIEKTKDEQLQEEECEQKITEQVPVVDQQPRQCKPKNTYPTLTCNDCLFGSVPEKTLIRPEEKYIETHCKCSVTFYHYSCWKFKLRYNPTNKCHCKHSNQPYTLYNCCKMKSTGHVNTCGNQRYCNMPKDWNRKKAIKLDKILSKKTSTIESIAISDVLNIGEQSCSKQDCSDHKSVSGNFLTEVARDCKILLDNGRFYNCIKEYMELRKRKLKEDDELLSMGGNLYKPYMAAFGCELGIITKIDSNAHVITRGEDMQIKSAPHFRLGDLLEFKVLTRSDIMTCDIIQRIECPPRDMSKLREYFKRYLNNSHEFGFAVNFKPRKKIRSCTASEIKKKNNQPSGEHVVEEEEMSDTLDYVEEKKEEIEKEPEIERRIFSYNDFSGEESMNNEGLCIGKITVCAEMFGRLLKYDKDGVGGEVFYHVIYLDKRSEFPFIGCKVACVTTQRCGMERVEKMFVIDEECFDALKEKIDSRRNQ